MKPAEALFNGTPVPQHHLPGGGSDSLRWVSPADFAQRARVDDIARRRRAERQYNPYGPGVK